MSFRLGIDDHLHVNLIISLSEGWLVANVKRMSAWLNYS